MVFLCTTFHVEISTKMIWLEDAHITKEIVSWFIIKLLVISYIIRRIREFKLPYSYYKSIFVDFLKKVILQEKLISIHVLFNLVTYLNISLNFELVYMLTYGEIFEPSSL